MYYPKSQLKTNLYTNGKEYSLSTTKEEYIGYYYETSTGKQYTGRTPQDGPNILLILSDSYPNPIIENQSTPPEEIVPLQLFEYIPSNTPIIRIIPIPNPTLPTPQDQQNGQFTRYFCKKTNENIYLEIDQNTYKQLVSQDPKIAWDLYNPTQITWIIKGDKTQVYTSNKGSVTVIEQQKSWYGFTQWFKDKFLQYYLES